MVELLPSPELQFADGNGLPYSGGTLAFYTAGTSTPKNTWSDSGGTVLNANPLTLDSAGRAVVWGDGQYRMVLHDVNGNLIFDQTTTTMVSAAMAPVCIAADLPTARAAMGITSAISTEASARAAADSAEASARAAADSTEASTRAAADTTLTTNLAAEVTRAEAAEAALSASIAGITGSGLKTGSGTTDGSANATVTYGSPFATASDAVVCTPITSIGAWIVIGSVTRTGFTVRSLSPDAGGDWSLASTPFYWMASGH